MLPLRPRRAFTLIELTVTILVIAVLAVVAVIGYSTYTQRAALAAAQTQLRNVAEAVQVRATSDGASALTRDMVAGAIEDHFQVSVHPGQSAQATWDLLDGSTRPTSSTDLSLAFETADGTPVADAGTRMLISTLTGDGKPAAILVTGVDAGACFVPLATSASDAAADVLARTPYCPQPEGGTNADTTAPSAPVLSVTADGANASLTWSPSTDDTAVAGYEVHRSDKANFTASKDNQLAFVHATTFTDTPPAAGTWFYQVLAFDAAGNHTASAVVSATTLSAAPGGVLDSGSSGIPTTPATTTGSATIDPATGVATFTWSPVQGATDYQVRFQVDAGAWITLEQTGTTLTRTISAGQTITFQVAGANATGTADWSTPATVGRPPAAPVLTGSFQAPTSTATITWPAVTAASSYVVRDSIDGGSWDERTTTALSAEGTLTAGQSSQWQVAAVSAYGQGLWSTPVTVQAPPAAPLVAGTFDADTGTSSVTWGSVPSADGYLVQFAVDGGTWVSLEQGGTTVSRTISDGQTITWRVAATNASGQSPWSAQVTHTRTPGSPVLSGSLDQVTGVSTVSWTAPAGASSYITRYRVDGSDWTTQPTTQTTASRTISAGQSIDWQVAAVSAGGQGTWSTVLSQGAAPAAPSLTGSFDPSTGTSTLTWSAPTGATSYVVQFAVDGGAPVQVSSTDTTASRTISAGQSIVWQVAALGAGGQGPWSATVSATRAPASPVLTGTLDQATRTSVVSWTTPAGATSFVVRYRLDGGDWTQQATTDTTGTKSLTPGQTIDWQVAGVSTGGQGLWSTALTHTAVPDAPTLTGTFDATTGVSTVTWSTPAGATGVQVQASVDGGTWADVPVTDATANRTISAGQSIAWQAAASNAGGSSAWSSALTYTRAPGSPVLSGAFNSATGVSSVSWSTPAGATSFVVQYRVNAGTWTSSSTTATTATQTIAAGQTIDWQVAGVGTGGQGAWSTILTHQQVPAAPVLTGSFDSSTGTSTIAWPAVTSASSYTVTYTVDGGAPTQVTTTALTYSRTISAGQSISWQVVATNGGGDSAVSNTVTAARAPAAPVLTGSFDSTTGVSSVSWSTPAGATSFVVQYRVNAGTWTSSSTTATTATQTIAAGQTIDWQVAGVGTGGQGAWSTILTHQQVPAAPVLTGSLDQSTGISTISWSAVSSATGYTVRYQVNSGAWVTSTQTSTTASATISAGQTISWQVDATNGGGTSAWSSALTYTRTPVAPLLTGTYTAATMTSNVSWTTPAGTTSFSVRYQVNGGAWTTQSTTATTAAKTITAGQTLTWQVAAVNGAGQGAWSTPVTAQQVTAAPAISGSLVNSTGVSTITWAAVAGAASYNVTQNVSGTVTKTNTTSTSASTTIGYAASVTWSVTAVSPAGESSTSNTVTYTRVPETPTNVAVAKIHGLDATISWSAAPGAASYTVKAGSYTATSATTSATMTLPAGLDVYVSVTATNGSTSSATSAAPELHMPDSSTSYRTLTPGTTLGGSATDMRWQNGLVSSDGTYVAYLQSDGNWAIWNVKTNSLKAETKTSGVSSPSVAFQGDGNLVLYGNGGWLRQTQTNGTAANTLVMQTDGNLVVKNSSSVFWALQSWPNAAPYGTSFFTVYY